MALINCPDCGTQVSDRAAACVKCGAPIADVTGQSAPHPDAPQVQTIEQTGKAYKAQQAMGVVAILVGAVMMAAGDSGSGTTMLGAIVAFIGMILCIFGRVGAWWNHE